MQINNIILDRDGVINHDSIHYIKTPDEFIFIEKSIAAVELLYNHNINIFIATNQSGINRNLYDLDTYLNINNKMLNKLNSFVTAVYYCPHTPEDKCVCRKPLTGMINKIKTNHKIDLSKTVFIGDSMRDIIAGKDAGVKYNYLVKTGKGLDTYNKHSELFDSTNTFDDLYDCAQFILNSI